GREGLVVRHHKGGASVRRDHMRQGHGLARTGNPKQGLVPVTAVQPRRELGDGPGLVTRWLERRLDVESGHSGNIAPGSGKLREKRESEKARKLCLRAPVRRLTV